MRRRCTGLWLLVASCTRPSAPPATQPTAPPPEAAAPDAVAAPAGNACSKRIADPPGLLVEQPCGTPRATFTDGARTVVIVGPERRFTEPSAPSAVRTSMWVRVLRDKFGGSLDASLSAWLDQATQDTELDLLGVAMQYLDGAPPVLANGLQIAGDAAYGPPSDAGLRVEGADFNDYLGVSWTYADGTVDRPHADMLHSLDCSGYMRMIWGYRRTVPMAAGPSDLALPRRAVEIQASMFGVAIIPVSLDAGSHVDRLQVGDLVFFDADPSDGPAIDHVGMFLGVDEAGHPRFISSRKGANGPTFGDELGAAVLDGKGLYASSFRAAKRL